MPELTNKKKRNIQKVIGLSSLWFFFGFIYTLIEQGILADLDYYPATGNPYDFATFVIYVPIASFILGLIQNSVEVFYLSQRFHNYSFAAKTVIKSAIYILVINLILISLTIVGNSLVTGNSVYSEAVLNSVIVFFYSFAYVSIVIYMAVIITLSLFISEISDNLGQGVLLNFLTGKYHRAREETRIFMFLDMKSSTQIAEKLGHVRYYQLLNQYYRDMSDAILDCNGEIYQYVGDEVIISWQLEKGIAATNCLNCFFRIKTVFETNANRYKQEYGLIPEFKAALHYGEVTSGEIGLLKKEIVFSGDVLNTTARIQSLCNEHQTDLLVSEQLIKLFHHTEQLRFKEIGSFQLRGKEESVKLMSVY